MLHLIKVYRQPEIQGGSPKKVKALTLTIILAMAKIPLVRFLPKIA